jgi:DinB family protein
MKNTLEAARSIMATTVARWEHLVASVPPDVLERRPAPGEWSAAECLAHLLFTERHLFSVRLRNLLAGEDIVPYDPQAPRDPEPERSPHDNVRALAELRRESARLIDALAPADLARVANHPEYGVVTLSMLLNLWTAHDLQHTVQAEEALMQVFIEGTGPWRREFADHDVEVRAPRT